MVQLLHLAVAIATCIVPSAAHPANGPRESQFGCASTPSADFLAKTAEFSALERGLNVTESSISTFRAGVAADTITIQAYFHVVAKSTAASDGYLSATQLTNQLAVMNEDYAPFGIQFTLAGSDYTINTSWASADDDLAMKKALRKGTYRDLNVYFQYDLQGPLGQCYFPTSVTSTTSDDFYNDGCVILYSTAPGGSETDFNLGKTVTHEVGHWFGLLHTFQGGCTGTGDSIADTPAQASASTGCPTGRDSCPDVAGLDPIHNYMDYSYDSCYEEFTPDQNTRMLSMFNTYRA